MSIDIYPAHEEGNNIVPANDWANETTMNLANSNFYTFAEALMGKENAKGSPGHWLTAHVQTRISYLYTSNDPATRLLLTHPYTRKLMDIVTWALENNARIIAYA